MLLSDVNPFLRYAKVQPAIAEGDRLRSAYDCRLFYILEGKGTLVTEEKEIPLAPGTALYFLPGVPYRFEGHLKIIAINFDLTRSHTGRKTPRPPEETGVFRPEEILWDDPPQELAHRIVVRHASALESLLKRCVGGYLCPSTYTDAMTSAILKEALALLLEEEGESACGLPKTVREILLYLRENFDREHHNDEVAAAFGYHPIYLNRMFKKYTGKTLHRTLLEIRIKNAKSLLKRTSLSVEEIVKESGFSDRTQFSTAFRKTLGMTPSEYRKESRKWEGKT